MRRVACDQHRDLVERSTVSRSLNAAQPEPRHAFTQLAWGSSVVQAAGLLPCSLTEPQLSRALRILSSSPNA